MGSNKTPRARPAHFPITPFLNPPPLPPLPQQHLQSNHSLRLTRMEHESARRGHSSPMKQAPPEATIYDAVARSNNPYSEQVSARESIVDIPASSKTRQAVPPLLSPNPVTRERYPSRSSSTDNLSNAPSIYSPSSTMTDLNDIHEAHARLNSSEQGYESTSTVGRGGRRNRSNVRAHMETAEVLEEHADEDKVSARISISSKMKADKVLGLAAPTTGLVSAYICSGLGLVSRLVLAMLTY